MQFNLNYETELRTPVRVVKQIINPRANRGIVECMGGARGSINCAKFRNFICTERERLD